MYDVFVNCFVYVLPLNFMLNGLSLNRKPPSVKNRICFHRFAKLKSIREYILIVTGHIGRKLRYCIAFVKGAVTNEGKLGLSQDW